MASHSNSDVEDADLAMALRLPELSADALDERIGQSRPKEPPPAARLTDHFSGEQDDPGQPSNALPAPRSDYGPAEPTTSHELVDVLVLARHGTSLIQRYEKSAELAELEEGANALSVANEFIPNDHPTKTGFLSNLGTSLLYRFERTGQLADAEKAVVALQQVLALTPDDHPHKPGRFDKLGFCFFRRYECLYKLADVDKAIEAQQQAVNSTPDDHPHKPGRLNNLGFSLCRRFEHLGGLADIERAIAVQQQAATLTLDGQPDKAGFLNNLGSSFLRRFEHLGELADVDKAITTHQQAVTLSLDGHPDKPSSLNNLGISLFRRFECMGELADVNRAITVQQQAVALTPNDHPHKAGHLNNLGTSFICRFERLGKLSDVDSAITAHQQAVTLTLDGHSDKPGRLNNLGTSFIRRFERLDELSDLEQAIAAHQQAVDLTPDGHPHKPGFLSSLGSDFLRRFERLGELVDIDKAIKTQQRVLALTPEGHPYEVRYLNNLGFSFDARLTHQPDEGTLEQAIATFSRSAKSLYGPPPVRFAAARRWAELCAIAHSNEVIDAYSTLIGLLPHVVWLGKTVEERYNDISSTGDAVTDAVATAIRFEQFNLALEWLEQGRSIVWGQILQLRSPLDELRQHHPKEATKLETISHALESAGTRHHDANKSLEEDAQAHRRLAEEYTRSLEGIRALSGFNEFMQPKKSASLRSTAVSGPVVIVNVHKIHCDALILHPHSSQVSHVPLPGLELIKLSEMQVQLAGLTRTRDTLSRDYEPYGEAESLTLSGILEQLWRHVAQPILHHLQLLQKPAADKMPHITWCTTGVLTFLPIHAAGLYDANDQPKVFDFVISSYSPTLTALLSAKRPTTERNQFVRLLAVSQPATPRQRRLPGTLDEVNAIQTFQSQTDRLLITRLDDREATVAAVLQNMNDCNWVHLACHGVQDNKSAIDSAFHLIDGPLTLREIMKQSFSHTELAVLSACQTATGDKTIPEEAVHLAAGMLMAGYQSVVGTMWRIRDNDAPILAKKFYSYLISEGGRDSANAAYALHYAVAHLRSVRGENDFAGWVPYIHLGICSARESCTPA